ALPHDKICQLIVSERMGKPIGLYTTRFTAITPRGGDAISTAKASPAVWHALRGARNHPRFEASSAWIFRPSYHRQACAFRRRVGGRQKVPLKRLPQVARTSPPRFHPFPHNQTDHSPT